MSAMRAADLSGKSPCLDKNRDRVSGSIPQTKARSSGSSRNMLRRMARRNCPSIITWLHKRFVSPRTATQSSRPFGPADVQSTLSIPSDRSGCCGVGSTIARTQETRCASRNGKSSEKGAPVFPKGDPKGRTQRGHPVLAPKGPKGKGPKGDTQFSVQRGVSLRPRRSPRSQTMWTRPGVRPADYHLPCSLNCQFLHKVGVI